MRWLIGILATVVVLVIVGFLVRTPDTDPEQMIAKYTNQHSSFAENEAGLRVHYRDEGNPRGEAIVFVHGGGASLHVWEDVIAALGDHYRLVSLSLPGHGLTGPHPDEDYSFAGMASAIDLVADTLGLERFSLVGSSLGGWVSWRYALARPERVQGLVLMAAAGALPPEGEELEPDPLFLRLQMTAFGRAVIANFLPRDLVQAAGEDATYGDFPITDDEVDRFWELMRYPGNRSAPSVLPQSVYWDPAFDARLPEIKAPTLIVWGRNDTFVPLSHGKEFARHIPDATLLIYEETGHVPMQERPQKTAEDIDQFMQGVLN